MHYIEWNYITHDVSKDHNIYQPLCVCVCVCCIYLNQKKKNPEYILKCVQTFLEEYEVLKEFNSSTQIWLHLVTEKLFQMVNSIVHF